MSLATVVRELRLHRPTSLLFRAYFMLLGRIRLALLKGGRREADPARLLRALHPRMADDLAGFVRHIDSRSTPTFFAVPRQFDDQYGSTFDAPDSLLSAADEICRHRFSALGSPTVEFDGTVDWHHSLHRDARWPTDHWRSINYRALTHLGDIKCCWEWNRHQSFVTLGRAYRATGDPKYAKTFTDLLGSWCEQNPPEIGIHYISNLELGLRCLSWLWAHHLFAPSEHYSTETRSKLHLHCFLMAQHIAENLSYTRFTARNNHLIGDTACLAIVAIMYPELSIARKWRDRALATLWSALRRQVRADGMHFEGSFGYHCFVVELVTQVTISCRANGVPVPDDITVLLEKMFDPIAAALVADGKLPNLNDDDGGTALPIRHDFGGRAKCLLAVGASMFRRADLKSLARGFSEEAFWLLGETGFHMFEQIPSEPNNRSDAALTEAGIYIMRSGRERSSDVAIVDSHPDPFPDSGHGHASLLQLLLWTSGEPLLLDGGTYRYNADDGYRNVLRSTAAHNTIEIDSTPQAIPVRNFGWLSRLRPGSVRWRVEDDWVLFDGSHSSFPRVGIPVRHRRVVIWLRDPSLWLVFDGFVGRGSHRYDQHWHFPAHDIRPLSTGDGYEVSTNNEVVFVRLPGGHDEITVVTGGDQVPMSWHSPEYGVLEPSTTVTRTWRASVPSSRWTLFVPSRFEAARDLHLDLLGDAHLRLPQIGLEVRVTDDSTTVTRR